MITGAGRAFSSGADLKDAGGGDFTPDGRPDVYKVLTERYHPIMHAIRELAKPVIASVNGPAVGIGCSLALCCDLIVAARSAYFLLAFVNIGLVPDGGSSLFVPSRVGMARASELALLGERLPAEQALEWGLINRVVADERPERGGGHARRAPGRRADALLRRSQAPAQQLAVSRGWPSSSSWRRRSSARWPAARTSWRARWRSSKSVPHASRGDRKILVAKVIKRLPSGPE